MEKLNRKSMISASMRKQEYELEQFIDDHNTMHGFPKPRFGFLFRGIPLWTPWFPLKDKEKFIFEIFECATGRKVMEIHELHSPGFNQFTFSILWEKDLDPEERSFLEFCETYIKNGNNVLCAHPIVKIISTHMLDMYTDVSRKVHFGRGMHGQH